MNPTISKIRDLLSELEIAEEAKASTMAVFPAMEIPDIIADVVDTLMPLLTAYQATFYFYLFRHSVLSTGRPLLRVSTRALMQGVMKSASGQSVNVSLNTVRENLAALEAIGAIAKQGEPNRDGTPYKVCLPDEIDACRVRGEQVLSSRVPEAVTEKDLDYYNVRKNRLIIYERDGYRCCHCTKQLTRLTATLDHIVAVTNGGDNSIDNLITACLTCNSRKNARAVGDFLADSNPT